MRDEGLEGNADNSFFTLAARVSADFRVAVFATGARDGACIPFIVRDTLGTKIRRGLVEGRKDERGKKGGSRSSRLASGVVIRGVIGASFEEKLAGTNKYLLTNP